MEDLTATVTPKVQAGAIGENMTALVIATIMHQPTTRKRPMNVGALALLATMISAILGSLTMLNSRQNLCTPIVVLMSCLRQSR